MLLNKHKLSNLLLRIFILSIALSKIPTASAQLVDFSAQKYDPSKQYLIIGKWEFYSNSFLKSKSETNQTPILVDLPSSWGTYQLAGKLVPNYGYGTYYIKVKLPQNTHNLALVTNRIKLAHNVYVNGHLIGGDGTPADTRKKTYNSANLVISRIPDSDQLSEIEIAIQVSNFVYPRSGIDEIPYICDADSIQNAQIKRLIESAFMGGAFFLIGLYHLALWYRRRVEWPSLIFSIFCLTGSLRVFVAGAKAITAFIPGLPSEILLTLDLWTVYTAIPFMHFYVYLLFPTIFNKYFLRGSIVVWVVLTFIVLFTSLTLQARAIPFFEFYVLLVFTHILSVGISAIRQRLESSILFTSVFVVVILTGINDILVERRLIPSYFSFHYGILIFTFAQAVVLSRRFTNVFGELERLNENLEQQVLARTKELSKSKEDSERLHQETKLLSSKLDSILEDERKSIAMVMHDSLGASLVGFKHKLASLKGRIFSSTQNEPVMQTIDEMIKDVNKIYDKTRVIVSNLRPELIDVFGLKSALEAFIKDYNAAGDLLVTLDVIGDIDNLEERVGISLFRICQESVTNVIKHARATEVNIVFKSTADRVVLTIEDNGVGFDTAKHIGIGLIGMREKVQSLNGSLQIESTVNIGTRLTFTLPRNVNVNP